MHKATLLVLAAVFAVALSAGQYYVPRAYYTIDAEGHESLPVPLRRLRRNIAPPNNYPWNNGGGAGVGGGAHACTCPCRCPCPGSGSISGNSAGGSPGYYPPPSGNYGSSNPNAKGN